MKFTTEYGKIPLDLFRHLPGETWSERFFRAGEFANAHVDARAAAVLRAVGAFPGEDPAPAAELAAEAGVPPEREGEFLWLLRKLARSGYLEIDPSGRARSAGPAPDDPEELRARILGEDPALSAVLDIVDAAAKGYPEFLRGEREGSSILFQPGTLALWEKYFSNSNPAYAPSNRLGAFAARGVLEGRAARVLEAGGGLGSGAEGLLEALGAAPAVPVERYCFTEVSPGFLRRGERFLAGRFPAAPFEFRLLDLNRSLAAQGIPAEAFNLAFAVNTLHVVRDLLGSLRELWRALEPGGWLVLVEGVRPEPGHPLSMEFVFQLLREFRDVRLDAACRPHGGFLEWPHWRAALERSGFADVRSVPDAEKAARAYSEYAMAAIVGRKPAGGAAGAGGPS